METIDLGVVTREERLRIQIKLDRQKAQSHQDDVTKVMNGNGGNWSMPNMGNEDVLNVNYTFSCLYLNRIDETLAAICRILDDSEIVLSADINEFKHGESLLVNIVDKIRNIQNRLESPVCSSTL